MSRYDDEGMSKPGGRSLVVRVADHEFQGEVLERLGRLEAKMDMIAGSTQPGRMKAAEDRINLLERSDVRRAVYDRLVNAVIATAVSALIAWKRSY